MKLIEESRRPLFWPMEASWDLYELYQNELWDVAAMWGDPPFTYTLGELLTRVKDGRYGLNDVNRTNLTFLRQLHRDGTLHVGELVAMRRSGIPNVAAGHSDSLCLLDGHHRVLVLRELDQVPATLRMFVGMRPVPIGTAVLNGMRT